MLKLSFPWREALRLLSARVFLPEKYYKRKELQKLLKIADNNPFYKKHYENIDLSSITPDNISRLPFVNKDILMDNFFDWTKGEIELEDMIEFGSNPDNYNKLYKDKYHICSSSGTSKRVFYSPEDARDFGRELVMGTLSGMPYMKDRIITALGLGRMAFVIPTAAPYSFSMCCEYYLDTTTKGSTVCIDVITPIEEMVGTLNKARPYALGGYILTLLELAEEAEKGKLKINPKLIYTTGDTYKRDQRRKIEKAFGCKSVGMYASTECGLIAWGDNPSYYEVNREIIVEPMDAEDNPVKEGEISDHVYVTCLWRKDFPIIRYRLDDKCMLVEGGTHMKIQPAGRDTPLLTVEQNGTIAKINGYGILNITEEFSANIHSQLVIDRNCNIGIKAVGNEEDCRIYVREVTKRVTSYLEEKYGVTPRFYRDDTPLEKLSSGKYAELIYKE